MNSRPELNPMKLLFWQNVEVWCLWIYVGYFIKNFNLVNLLAYWAKVQKLSHLTCQEHWEYKLSHVSEKSFMSLVGKEAFWSKGMLSFYGKTKPYLVKPVWGQGHCQPESLWSGLLSKRTLKGVIRFSSLFPGGPARSLCSYPDTEPANST